MFILHDFSVQLRTGSNTIHIKHLEINQVALLPYEAQINIFMFNVYRYKIHTKSKTNVTILIYIRALNYTEQTDIHF